MQQRQKRLHAPAALQVLQETRAALYMLVNLSVNAALKFAHICNEILSCLKTYLTRVHIDNNVIQPYTQRHKFISHATDT